MDSPYLRVRHARRGQGRETWTLIGEIDLLTIPLLHLALRSADGSHTVMDLTHVKFLDMAGARAIATAATRARDAGRRFSVVAPTTAVRRVLTASGLADQLEIHSTLLAVFPTAPFGHTGGVLAPTTEEHHARNTGRTV